jgi:beta-galactosidase
MSVPQPALLRHPRGIASGRGGLGFGADYNPEQWPESVWAEDARLMKEAGVTFATVGVFSWALLEPRPGHFELDWRVRVMDLLDEHDIAVDLATATASPPPWLTHLHPEVLPVDHEGRRLAFGSRQTWCPSSPVYREHALSLLEALATRVRGHPALVLWHVSNELGCHNAHCYCDVSAESFRRWLRERHGSLDALNDAWGTAFWSQHYGAWEEIGTPRLTTAVPNPTQQLDFLRFSSDELLGQHLVEREVLRRLTPDVPVTTNFMVSSHIEALDYHRWAPSQDVVSNDHYLDHRIEAPEAELSFCADWTRGLASGKPWILMEHSTSAVNWQPVNRAKSSGQMRRNTLQHVARGADTAGFFQWRASRSGGEKYHSGLVPHAGTDTRLWREVVALGGLLRDLGGVAGTEVESHVAMLLDRESAWAVQRASLPRDDLRYLDRALDLHRSLTARAVAVDVRHPEDDLVGLPVVLAPMLHLLDDAAVRRLDDYVRAGGHLVVTYFSGVVDERDHVRLGGYPGALRELLGIRVEEVVPLPSGTTVTLDGELAGSADTWTEDLDLAGATAVASYVDGPLAGTPAITQHAWGEGMAWYVATRTAPGLTDDLVARVLTDAGLDTQRLPEDVEVVRRRAEDRSYLFVLNHGGRPAGVACTGRDLVSGAAAPGNLTVEPFSVAVVEEEVRSSCLPHNVGRSSSTW